MEFGFTSEQALLRKSFSEFLAKECPLESVKELRQSGDGFSKQIWKKIADLGWLGLSFPEAYGGSEGSFMDLFILFEEIGKAQMPGPLLESIGISAQLIYIAGSEVLKKAMLTPLFSGKKTIIPAFLDEKGNFDGYQPNMKADPLRDGTFAVSGTRILVPYADAADEILVCCEASGPTLFKINADSEGLNKTLLNTMSGNKQYAVSFKSVSAAEADIIGEKGKGISYLSAIQKSATALKCAEMIGGMQRVVDRTVAYVKERHQFGKALGTLQAVQHFCADMTTLSESGRLIAYQAGSLLSEGLDCNKEVAMAKAWCSDGYKKCTWIAHQIHGGIGFTDEFSLDLYYKHAKEAELSFGDSWVHRMTVADDMGL